jgi:phosphohistidine phosphatase SixA
LISKLRTIPHGPLLSRHNSINHATRRRHLDRAIDKQIDPDQPLLPQGEEEACKLADRLRDRQVVPTLYLTSRNLHSRQTAKILCKRLGGDPRTQVVQIGALTPHHETEHFEQIIEQAEWLGQDLQQHDWVAVVGHYPMLNQLFARLTGQPEPPAPLDRGQEVCLTANCLDGFLAGEGKGEWPRTSKS